MSKNENLNQTNNENPNIANPGEPNAAGENTTPEAAAAETQSADSARPEPSAGAEAETTKTHSSQSETDRLEAEAWEKREKLQAIFKKMIAQADDGIAHFKVIAENAKAAQRKPKRERKMLTHGVYSDDHVLPWEQAADFDKLYDENKEEWQPQGRSEEEAVFDLTNLTWLKRRAQKMSQLAYQCHPFAMEENSNWTWPDIIAAQKLKGAYVADALLATKALMNAMKLKAEILDKIPHESDTQSGKDAQQETFKLRHRVAEFLDELEKRVIPFIGSLSEVAKGQIGTFDLAYDPEELSKQVRLEASIQARIDKAYNRLVLLKEYKSTAASRMSTLPRVSSPAISASPNVAPTLSETADAVPTSNDATEE